MILASRSAAEQQSSRAAEQQSHEEAQSGSGNAMSYCPPAPHTGQRQSVSQRADARVFFAHTHTPIGGQNWSHQTSRSSRQGWMSISAIPIEDSACIIIFITPPPHTHTHTYARSRKTKFEPT